MGKLPEFPHPVASSISSRMMVELGMVTAVMAAAAVVVGGFLASAVFAVTSFIFATAVYVVWPLVKPFLRLFTGIISGILERVWDNVIDVFSDGGVFSKLNEIYTFGGISASLEMLKPIMLVFLTMALLVRFTLSRRPKNFRKWVRHYLPHFNELTDIVLYLITMNFPSYCVFVDRIYGKALNFHNLKHKLVLMLVSFNYLLHIFLNVVIVKIEILRLLFCYEILSGFNRSQI